MRRRPAGPGPAVEEHRLSPAGTALQVGAPFAAWVWPLEETPDAAFASGAVGPGVALDPLEGRVFAPFAGRVATLPASAHAVALRHACGAEVLVHVGIDTVTLGGRGFEALVAPGDAVAAGQPLIRFDLDAIARAGRSLVSPVVVLNAGGAALELSALHRPVEPGALLFTLSGLPVARAAGSQAAPTVVRRLRVGLVEGLHARPAAALARIAREQGIDGRLQAGAAEADLRSVAALMALAVRAGDIVELRLPGGGSEAGLAALAAVLQAEPTEGLPGSAVPGPASRPDAQGALPGLRAAPGIASGPAFRRLAVSHAAPAPAGPPEAEAQRLTAALDVAAQDLEAEAAAAEAEPAELLRAHADLARDPVVRAQAVDRVAAGASAAAAWREVADAWAARFAASGDARLAARAADLEDLRARVLRRLLGDDGPADPPAGAILLAPDVAPSEVPRLARAGVAGLALAGGGALGHAALLAQAAGLPMLAQLGADLLDIADGVPLLLDADRGRLHVAPATDVVQAALARSRAQQEREARARADAAQPAVTLDGQQVLVLANLGAPEEAAPAVALGAEGCGLFRTEFVFLRRRTPPPREQQALVYAAAAAGLAGRPLTLRLLDAGSDKALAWLPPAAEPNPALGRRGVRLLLGRPEVLETQLRAVASLSGAVSISVPMIERAGELRAIRRALDAASVAEGRTSPILLGAMIETPAAALGAAAIAAEADFLSIGSNDLAQYVLARDREGADPPDPLDPAVLHVIALVVAAGAARGRPVTLCGAAASDPLGIPLLLGLGLRRLSCAPAAIPGVKALVRRLDAGACEAVLAAALAADDAAAVRAGVRAALPILEGFA